MDIKVAYNISIHYVSFVTIGMLLNSYWPRYDDRSENSENETRNVFVAYITLKSPYAQIANMA